MKFICSKCRHEEELSTRKPRCDCGGLWKLNFTPPKFDEALIDKATWNIFRYRKFMPLIDDSWKAVTLGEGMTPIIRFNDDVLLKMDYFMPTLSFKDRGAAVLVAHCKSIGVDAVIRTQAAMRVTLWRLIAGAWASAVKFSFPTTRAIKKST